MTVLEADTSVAERGAPGALSPLAVFLCAMALFWLCDPLGMGLLFDNQHYFFIAERAASGVPPHLSQFDPKHALSLLMTGAAIKLGRLIGADDVYAARVLSLLVGATGAALLWVLTLLLTRRRLAAWLAALVMLSFSGFLEMVVMGSRPKTFLVLFAMATLVLHTLRRPLAAGAGAGLAFLCWQPALIFLGAIAAAALWEERRPGPALLALAGALAVQIPYEAYFAWHGALGEQLLQAYVFPARYMAGEFAGFAGSLAELREFWGAGFGPTFLLPVVFVLTLALGVVLLAARPRWAAAELRERPGWLAFGLAATSAAAFTFYDHQGFPDFFLVLPFVAVVVGWLAAAALTRISQAWPPALASAAALALLGGAAAWAVTQLPQPRVPYGLDEQRQLAQRVGEYLRSGKSVYAVGCVHLLALNHASNHLPYGFFFRGVEPYLLSRSHGSFFEPARDGKMADVVLISRSDIYPVPDRKYWLGTRYVQLKDRAFNAQGIRVWIGVWNR